MLCLWAVLIGFSSSDRLHQCLHSDSGQVTHDCLVTSFAKSQSLALPAEAALPPASFFEVGRIHLSAGTLAFPSDRRLSPPRGPPPVCLRVV
jgi:hypothetical protein